MRDKLSVNKSDLDIFVFFIPFTMFVYMLFYVLLPFNEEVTEFRKLQNMSSSLFWFTNYAIDLLIHTIFCGVIYATLKVLDTHHIFEQEDYTTLTTLLLFYGISYIPLIYVFGQSFTSMSSLYSFLSYSFLSYFFLIFSESTTCNKSNNNLKEHLNRMKKLERGKGRHGAPQPFLGRPHPISR